MIGTRRERDKVGSGSRDIDLTFWVVSPAENGAVRFQSQAMDKTRRERDHVRSASRDIDLTLSVVSPAENGAVRFQSQAVISTLTRCNGVWSCMSRCTRIDTWLTLTSQRIVAIKGQDRRPELEILTANDPEGVAGHEAIMVNEPGRKVG